MKNNPHIPTSPHPQIITSIIITLFPIFLFSQNPYCNHWESIIYASDDWKYYPATAEPSSAWKAISFDDSQWLQASGGIGFGNNDDNTICDTVNSIYLRKTFTVGDSTKINALLLRASFDDAFVAYINGYEIARENIGIAWTPPNYDDTAYYEHQSQTSEGEDFADFNVSVAQMKYLLRNGENLLAIQVANVKDDTSGLTAIFNLQAGISDSSILYKPLPWGFIAPPIYQEYSRLPVVNINTSGMEIPDNNRIIANMGIVYNGEGVQNEFTGDFNHYNGRISIEVKGQSLADAPKKSYSFETQDAYGENNNIELLGMPSENDWILQSSYSDKTLLRNVLTYQLSNNMGQYAPRTRFCELIINDAYQGVYILTEKIKRDKERVDIAKLSPSEITGDDLTGGYILKLDKGFSDSVNGWTSTNTPGYIGYNDLQIQYHYPKKNTIAEAQKSYIQKYISELETVLLGVAFDSAVGGYHDYLEMQSFINYFLIAEFSKNVDSYQDGVYLYKDKESKNGKIRMCSGSDCNTAFGNVNFGSDNEQETFDWLYNKKQDRIFWFARLMEDDYFVDRTKCRWKELRETVFNEDTIFALIDDKISALGEARARNFYQWNLANKFVLAEVDSLKSWITDRLLWMDNNMVGTCNVSVQEYLVESVSRISTYPNPFTNELSFKYVLSEFANVDIDIYDINGRLIKSLVSENQLKGVYITKWDGTTENGREVRQGMYFYLLKVNNKIAFRGKIVNSLNR